MVHSNLSIVECVSQYSDGKLQRESQKIVVLLMKLCFHIASCGSTRGSSERFEIVMQVTCDVAA